MTAMTPFLIFTVLFITHLSSAGRARQVEASLGQLKKHSDYPSVGCQLPDLSEGFRDPNTLLSIESGGQERFFDVFVPEIYQPGVPLPLILSFPGHGITAEEQQELAGFSTNTDPDYNPGWIVVTPAGLNRAWEGAPYATPHYSDVDFTASLLDYLEANLCIDTSRVYAAGKSNGGGFVGRLACSYVSSRIAAYAPVSGAFYTNVSAPCNPARSIIPMIDFHGMADQTIPYYGGNNSLGYWLDPIPEVMRAWAQRQGCPEAQAPTTVYEKPAAVSNGMDEYWRSSWNCSTLGAGETIVAYNITGLGHAWPSTAPNSDSKIPTILNATPLIIKFFQSWTLYGPA